MGCRICFLVNPKKSIFAPEQMKKIDKKAQRLKVNQQGDQGVFYFKEKKGGL